MRETFAMLDQAARGLSTRFGISMDAAQRAASEYMFSGTLTSGVAAGASGGQGYSANPFSAGARSNLSKSTGESLSRSDSVQLGEMRDYLEQVSRSQGWDRQADAFNRASASSSRSDLQQAAQGVASRYSEAQSISRAATDSWEKTRRYEQLASLTSSDGASVNQDLSQEFVEYVLREQSRLPGGVGASQWNPTRGLPRTDREVEEKDFWVQSFIGELNREIEAGAESRLFRPTPAGIVAPTSNSQVGIEKVADENGRRVPGVPEGGTAVPLLTPDDIRLRRSGIDGNVEAARTSPAVGGRLEQGRAAAATTGSTVRRGVGETFEAERKRVEEAGPASRVGGWLGSTLGLPGPRDRKDD
jgi:hypothetical protein